MDITFYRQLAVASHYELLCSQGISAMQTSARKAIWYCVCTLLGCVGKNFVTEMPGLKLSLHFVCCFQVGRSCDWFGHR